MEKNDSGDKISKDSKLSPFHIFAVTCFMFLSAGAGWYAIDSRNLLAKIFGVFGLLYSLLWFLVFSIVLIAKIRSIYFCGFKREEKNKQ